MSFKLSVACLALIAVLLVGANLLIDDSGSGSGDGSTEIASGVVSSESSTLLVANLGAEIDRLRMRQAAAIADQQAVLRAEKLSRRVRAEAVEEKFDKLPGEVSRQTLDSIAECESGGDPRVVSSNGLYHGKYQFHPDTWESVGGKGLPSKAPEAEQDYRAALLYERSGPGQWPVCGS